MGDWLSNLMTFKCTLLVPFWWLHRQGTFCQGVAHFFLLCFAWWLLGRIEDWRILTTRQMLEDWSLKINQLILLTVTKYNLQLNRRKHQEINRKSIVKSDTIKLLYNSFGCKDYFDNSTIYFCVLIITLFQL